MAYCSQCGFLLASSVLFCSHCGAPAPTGQAASRTCTVYTGENHAVLLIGLNACDEQTASDLIGDICGYRQEDSLTITRSCPALVAVNLSQTQAMYLAQSLTEYGMVCAVYTKRGCLPLKARLASVFDSNGDFLGRTSQSLSYISELNRVLPVRRIEPDAEPIPFSIPRQAPRPPVRRHQLKRQAPRATFQPLRQERSFSGPDGDKNEKSR